MRRFLTPAWILGVCLVLSLSIHLPIYGALGVLKEVFRLEDEAAKKRRGEGDSSVEVSFEDPTDEADTPEDAPPKPEVTPKPEEKKKADTAKKEAKKEAPKKVPAAVVALQPKPPPPPPKMSPQAIKQKSDDPNAEPPPDTQYIAQENRRVEKETVAKVRNYERDDADPTAAAARHTESEEPGMDSEEDKVADARDRQGNESRHVTEEEAKEERPTKADETPPPKVAATGNGRLAGGDTGGAATRSGAAPVEYKSVQISDGFGTFIVRVPKEQGADAAQASVGTGGGRAGTGSGAGTAGRETLQGFRGTGAGFSTQGPRIMATVADALDALDPDELEKDRRLYVEERKSRLRGGKRQAMWKEFRAAIENFTPAVQPGNQTALNAAASPFADYLTAVHRRIHREYADDFIANLPMGDSPYSDPSLMTMLEIILNRDGTVHRVGVVTPSGVLPFDYGAYASVMKAQPFPEAPSSILSADGRVYFHWGFYRNQRQCGTFNAEPYILPNPPPDDVPSDAPGGLMPGGVMPRDAAPSWKAPTKEGRVMPPKSKDGQGPTFAGVHAGPSAG